VPASEIASVYGARVTVWPKNSLDALTFINGTDERKNRVPRFLVTGDSSKNGQIEARKGWFPVLEWGTWRLANNVSARRTGDGKTNI